MKFLSALAMMGISLWTFGSPVASAEKIILKSGQEVEGRITEKQEKKIKVNVQGIEITYWRDEIAQIEEGNDDSSSDLENQITENSSEIPSTDVAPSENEVPDVNGQPSSPENMTDQEFQSAVNESNFSEDQRAPKGNPNRNPSAHLTFNENIAGNIQAGAPIVPPMPNMQTQNGENEPSENQIVHDPTENLMNNIPSNEETITEPLIRDPFVPNNSDMNARIKEVEDSRSTEDSFSRLRLKLKIMGDILANAEAMRFNLTKAVDDTGRDLIKRDQFNNNDKYEKLDQNSLDKSDLEVNLLNPSRKAKVIQQLTGELEVFSPGQDPSATFKFPQINQNFGVPIPIAEHKIEITPYDTKTYEEAREQEAESQSTEQAAQNMGNAMAQLFTGMFGVNADGQNSIVLRIKDPQLKIVTFRFYGVSGEEMKSNSWMSMGEVQQFFFPDPLPEDITLVVMVKTDKSLQKIGINFNDIPLP